MVGVLVLVDQDVPEAAAVVLCDLRKALQHSNRLADQIIEVQRVGGAQPALVLGVDVGDDAGQVVGGLGGLGGGLFGPDQLVLQVRDPVGQQAGRVLLGVQAHVLADHQQQPARVVGVVDREVRVEAGQQRGLVAQDPHTRRVERRHPHRPRVRAHQPDDAFAHLGGGLVGERDGQDLADPDLAGGQQVGDAAGQHRGLTRPRSRHDQQRRPLVQHRLALLRVEPVEESLGPVVAPGSRFSHVHTHVCPNLPPRGDTLCAGTAAGGTLTTVLDQWRFFYGYRPAVPVV